MKNNTLKWLFSVAGRKKGYILLLILVQILHGASGVLYALLLRNIVDSAVEKNTDIFVLNVSLVILLVIAQLSMRAVIRFLNELSRASLENTLKERMMKHLLNKNFAAVDAVHSGEWLNRLTNDTVVVANGYAEILPGVAGMTVKMISAVIMIILLQPWFAWIMLPGGVVMVILTYAFRKVLKRLHKNVQEKDGSLRIFLQETLGNMMMIRSFEPFFQFLQYRVWYGYSGNVFVRYMLVWLGNTDGNDHTRYIDGGNAAYFTDTVAVCQYYGLSSEILCYDSERRKAYGNRKL